MNTSENKIRETLVEFREALESAEYDAAEDALNRLNTHYKNTRKEENILVRQIQTVIENGSLRGNKRESATRYISERISTNFGRAGILTGGQSYLLDPPKFDEAELLDAVEELASKEQELRDRRENVQQILSEVDVPPAVSILRISEPDEHFVVGRSITVDVTIRNVGETVASGVKVTCESALDVSPSSITYETLHPGEEQLAQFEFTGDEGEYDVTFKAKSDDSWEESQMTELSVVSKHDSASMAVEAIAEIREIVVNNDSLGRGRTTALLASLDKAASNVNSALRYIDGEKDHPGRGPPDGEDHPGRGPPDGEDYPGRGPPDGEDHPGRGPSNKEQANNALTTAINQMGAFLNKVDDFRTESSDEGVSEGFWFSLFNQGEVVIGQLARARSAQMDENSSDESGEGRGTFEDNPGRGPPEDDDNDDPGRGPPDDDDSGRGPPGN